jgi:two-component system CheB/CheR fusion protein
VLTIRDTGIGIEPELLLQVFESFMQAEPRLERSRGGLGLGLALAKGLVEAHGGTVTVTSPGPGAGTQVTVCLPLGEEGS